jgi:hypothetical protein
VRYLPLVIAGVLLIMTVALPPIVGQGRPSAVAASPAVSVVWGDVDCSGSVSIGDAQKISRFLIGLSVTQTPPCPQLGSHVSVDGIDRVWGDIDCLGGLTIGDAQKLARSLISLQLTQGPNCPGIGSSVSIGSTPTPTSTLTPQPTPTSTGGKSFRGAAGQNVCQTCLTSSLSLAKASPCCLPPTGAAPPGGEGFPWAWALVASALVCLGATITLGMMLEARRR